MPLMRKFCPLVLKKDIPDHGGIEERDLHVVPVLPIDRAVPLQAVIQEFGFPADFVVGQIVR